MISVGNPTASPMMPNTIKQKAPETNEVKTQKETEYKKITGGQIKDILATPQVIRSDCYLVSTLKSLAKSRMGKQMLKQSIKTSKDGDSFEIKFNKYDDQDNTYKIDNNKEYKYVTGRNRFNPTGAVETATNSLVKDKKDAKPRVIRMFAPICCGDTPVECNLASVYMENLTGRKPIALGDESLRPLSSKKEEATKLLDEIGSQTMNHHSFVAGSKLMNTKDGIGCMHYYVLKKVDKDKKEVHLVNPRYVDFKKGDAEKEFRTDLGEMFNNQEIIEDDVANVKKMPKVYKLSYDQFMNNFRSIVGYFDDKVMKNKK